MSQQKVAPNPRSPYADADPEYRHLIPHFLGLRPDPGVLALTACERMAVVPDEPLTDVTTFIMAGNTQALPPGVCPACIEVAAGKTRPERQPPATCRECGGGSSHGELCALCRQDLHDEWRAAEQAKPEESGTAEADTGKADAS